MNGRVFRIDIPAHQAVQELLPWYANGQLAPDEARRVHEHLQGCAQCRRDLEWEHGMHAEAARAQDETPAGLDMEAALGRLMPALGPQERDGAAGVRQSAGQAAPDSSGWTQADGQAPEQPEADGKRATGVRWWRAAAANQPSWLRWAMAAQWVVIAGLVALLVRPGGEPADYRVLGSGVAAGGNLVVVFQPNTSERELRRILQAQNARVVDGPTVTDAYLINVPAAGRHQALQSLRAESAVKLVEPLDGGSTP
ncbi:zf-HC2 domain-containing protein [Duganella aceris]|uniref:Zf-HC2 domain-containing protein n=1 Tax=Duganella aceris TaxID=2703883 RepID=A0ABX0FKQ3_9BURK|nr:zf-HC2 domain-containing protein [Duganella aceris]NGZ85039.1 zf-HC2 domain-containing protein [Duganella aceris]